MMRRPIFIAAFILLHSALSQQCSLDPNDEAEKVEVLILGGGIAGVSAARKLQVSGVTNFVLFEATDRLGGRIKEDEDTGYELGASWIHGLDPEDNMRHPIWREWSRCASDGPRGSATPYVSSAFADDGSQIDIDIYDEAEGRIADACEEVENIADTFDPDISLREALRRQGWEPTSALENMTDWLYIDFCAAIKAEKLSVRLYYENTYTAFLSSEDADAEDYLISDENGYAFVVRCMAEEFMSRVKLNTAISKIQTAEDCVCVTLDGNDERYCGDYAIVTFSIGVMQAAIAEQDESTVRFEPALPADKQAAINLVTLAHYAKIYLVFNITFWNVSEEIQQLVAYVSNERGWYPYILVDSYIPNTIVFDVAEELALKVQRQPVSTTEEEIMSILRKIYGNDIPDPVNVVVSNLTNDPYFRMAWTAFDVGVPLNITDQLMSPVGRLYFAGSSLNRSFYGYTHGGYGSGAYVANEIMMNNETSPSTAAHIMMPSMILSVIVMASFLLTY